MGERGRPRAFDRERALRRAMEVFWEHGYEGTSIADLTAAMGINAPSLYAAFRCKEALFREAVALYEREEGLTIPEAVSAREAMAELLRTAAASYTEPDKPRGCLIVLAATTYTPKTEGIRDHLAERRRGMYAEVKARLDRAVADGDIPADTDSGLLTDYLSTVLNGMSTRARDGASRAELVAVADAAMAAWDRLVGGEAERAGAAASR